ncbi:MAG: hypothetical protein ACRECH_04620 [Nitrososphaerales archaeon]
MILIAVAAVITVCGGVALAYPLLRSEVRRREELVAYWVNNKGRKLGLKGQYAFGFDRWSPRGSVGSGSYRPSSDEDRLLFGRIGGQLEGEAIERVNRMFWTDRKLAVLGVTLLIIGTSVSVASALM